MLQPAQWNKTKKLGCLVLIVRDAVDTQSSIFKLRIKKIKWRALTNNDTNYHVTGGILQNLTSTLKLFSLQLSYFLL